MPQVEEVLTNKVGNVKQILQDGLPKLDEPRLATPNGAPFELPRVKVPNGKTALENNEPLEMRAGKSTSGNRRFEETMRQKHLPEGTAKVIDGDKMTQAAKITNRPAADQIAFVKNGKGVDAVITEITEGNKSITHLERQLEGGQMIAQADKEFGSKVANYTYRVITNNQNLIRAIKANRGKVGRFSVTVINEGGKK